MVQTQGKITIHTDNATVTVTSTAITFNDESIPIRYSESIKEDLEQGDLFLQEDLEEEIAENTNLIDVIIAAMKFAKHNPTTRKEITVTNDDFNRLFVGGNYDALFQ